MSLNVPDSIIKMNTAVFIRSVCSVFKDMVDVDFTPEKMSNGLHSVVYSSGFSTISHYYGTIQGDFIMSTDEITAAKIAGVYRPDSNPDAKKQNREIYSSMMCEILNVSAHQSVDGLEQEYGRLVIHPPAWVFGEYHTADYVSGVGIIDSLYGCIQCTLLLNLAGT